MRLKIRTALTVAAASLALVVAVAAANNTFFTSIGDLVFPFTPPPQTGGPGAIDNMTIGGNTPAPTTVKTLQIDNGTRTATAVSGAATLNKESGVVTSEALTTAAAGTYTLTLTNSLVAATDIVMSSVQYGTSTTGSPAVVTVDPSAGQVVITVQNIAASAALNGTIVISYAVFK